MFYDKYNISLGPITSEKWTYDERPCNLEYSVVMKRHSLAVCSNCGMCHNGSQGAVCQPRNEAANLHVPDTHTASCHCDSQTSWLAQADGINLQFMTVNHVHLFKYVVDVPHLDCAVNWWGDHLHQSTALGVINWGSNQCKSVLVMIQWGGEYLLKQRIFTLGVPSPLYILELSRPIRIDMAVRNTTIFM